MADTLTKQEFIDGMSIKLTESNEIDESPYTAEEIAEAMFDAATKNSDATEISRAECDSIDGTKLGLIIIFFNTDKDKSGTVDREELLAFIATLDDCDLTEEVVDEMLSTMDTENTGEVSMNDFIEYFLTH